MGLGNISELDSQNIAMIYLEIKLESSVIVIFALYPSPYKGPLAFSHFSVSFFYSVQSCWQVKLFLSGQSIL